MMRFLTAGVAALFMLAGTASAAGELGRIDFPNSGSPEAQEPFLRGALLLHSFEYEDASEAFREAQRLDPRFALAYWGEAMTHNHPLWRQQDREAALEALARLAPTPEARHAACPTPRERGYLEAVEILFGEGDRPARNEAYADAMGRLARAYPEDLEAAAFHALSILGTAGGVRDFRTYMRAAAVAEGVFARNPEHPGAIHYLIHSYDDPVHAPLGLRPARVYARVAPAASHAQHMISHIYVALGWWDEAAPANEKAFAVSEERARRKDLDADALSYHALHWLAYTYLQQGRYSAAKSRVEAMERFVARTGSTRARWHFAAMRAGYLVETRRFDELTGAIDPNGLGLTAAAADLFASGLAALRTGQADAADDALDRLGARCREAGEKDGPDLPAARVMEKELAGLVAWERGRREEGLRLLQEAVALEETIPLEYGPPSVVKPSHELLGETLLETGRTADALAAFRKGLERAPRRALSLLGLARAAAREGRKEEAETAYAELREIWDSADPGLAESAELKVGVASDR